MITAKWRTKSLSVNANKILSFSSMVLSTGIELEEKISGNTAYQKKSSESPAELSIEIHVSSLLGNNPKKELDSWIKLSRDGKAGRFYVGKRDILGCTLILTKCEAKNIQLAPNGELKSYDLALTFEQASGRWTSKSAKESMVGGKGKGGGGGKKSKPKNVEYRVEISTTPGTGGIGAGAATRALAEARAKTALAGVYSSSISKGKEASKVSVVTGKSSTPAIRANRKTNTAKTAAMK